MPNTSLENVFLPPTSAASLTAALGPPASMSDFGDALNRAGRTSTSNNDASDNDFDAPDSSGQTNFLPGSYSIDDRRALNLPSESDIGDLTSARFNSDDSHFRNGNRDTTPSDGPIRSSNRTSDRAGDRHDQNTADEYRPSQSAEQTSSQSDSQKVGKATSDRSDDDRLSGKRSKAATDSDTTATSAGNAKQTPLVAKNDKAAAGDANKTDEVKDKEVADAEKSQVEVENATGNVSANITSGADQTESAAKAEVVKAQIANNGVGKGAQQPGAAGGTQGNSAGQESGPQPAGPKTGDQLVAQKAAADAIAKQSATETPAANASAIAGAAVESRNALVSGRSDSNENPGAAKAKSNSEHDANSVEASWATPIDPTAALSATAFNLPAADASTLGQKHVADEKTASSIAATGNAESNQAASLAANPDYNSNRAAAANAPAKFSIDANSTNSGSEPQRTVASQVDQARFVQRVAKAFRTADENGGEIRLRLSPPELGSVKMEVAIRNGTLSAHLEADTPAARSLLLDNLPALRQRLADQNIKIERFDVDLKRDGLGNGSANAQPNFSGSRDNLPQGQAAARVGPRTPVAAAEAPNLGIGANTRGDGQLNVIV